MGCPHQLAASSLRAPREHTWNSFLPLPRPRGHFCLPLPNLCRASKIGSWAASRAGKASPGSVGKKGGWGGKGSHPTAQGGLAQGSGVLPRPSKQPEGLLGRTTPASWPLAHFEETLASHPGTPGVWPLHPAFW